MGINVRRVVLSGLIAGVIELILKIIAGALYLDSLFRAAIEPVNPAWMANVGSTSGMIGFITINLLLGISAMYIYAAMRPSSLNCGIIGMIRVNGLQGRTGTTPKLTLERAVGRWQPTIQAAFPENFRDQPFAGRSNAEHPQA